MRRLMFACLLSMTACEPIHTSDLDHINAADMLTEQCRRDGVPRWSLTAKAAGTNCDVLLIQAAVPLDVGMIDPVHYAAPDSGYLAIHDYADQHRFRGVVYTDPVEHIWVYGAVAGDEAKVLRPCD